MQTVTCKQARRWMQESEDVDLLSARRLDRHLLECLECSQYRRSHVETDRAIRQALNAQVATVSVRDSVVQSLIAQAPDARRINPARRWPSARLLRSGATLVAAAAVAAGGALFAPGLLNRGSSPTPAGAAWHLQRPFIGYPLAVDPSHPGHLLVGAWGEVYQSSNGGAWTQTAPLPGDFRIRALAIDGTDSNRFIVASKRSILVSDDGGKTWREQLRTCSASRTCSWCRILTTPRLSIPDLALSGRVWTAVPRGRRPAPDMYSHRMASNHSPWFQMAICSPVSGMEELRFRETTARRGSAWRAVSRLT